MKTKPSFVWILLMLCVSIIPFKKGFSQSETNNFITYDTVLHLPGSSEPYWVVRISRPANMFTPDHPDTASRPVFFMMPGQGEVSTDTNVLKSNTQKFGPHFWKNHGWDGSVVLPNGTHYPILMTVCVTVQNVRPYYVRQLIDTLRHRYHLKWNSLHFMGLSMGGFTWGRLLAYADAPGDEKAMAMMRSFVSLEGNAYDNFSGYNLPNWASSGHWAVKYDGRYFGLKGIADSQDPYGAAKNIYDSLTANGLPNTAYFSMENIGGGAHCCWNDMLNPSTKNWLTGSQISVDTRYPNQKGTYYEPMSVFQWALMQGDTTLVGVSNPPPVVSAGSNITLIFPDNSTQLKGTATPAGGATIVSYKWSKIAGPSQYILADSTKATSNLSNLTVGIYTFRLTATDSKGASANSQVQVLTAAILPIEFVSFSGKNNAGTNLLIWQTTMEDGYFELERSIDAKNFTSIANMPANHSEAGTHTYSYADENAPEGVSYYRVKNIMPGGATKYSSIVKIINDRENASLAFYPNPARDYVTIQVQSKEKGFTVIRLVDMQGRLISEQRGFKSDNLYTEKINLNNISSGLYIVYCGIGDQVHNLGKVVKR